MSIWKDVKGYEGIYRISDYGVVESLDHKVIYSNGRYRIQKGRVLKQQKTYKGYMRICLTKGGVKFNTSVHRLISIAFIPNPLNKPQVNHKNGIKNDNKIENLEWCTNSENQIHAIKNNLIKHNVGEKHHMAKLSNAEVYNVRQLHKTGWTNKELAEDFNISQTAMSNILRKVTYK